MTHVSLFTGIGGIDLAAEWAGFTTIAQVEKDDYCQRVLAKHWPDVHRVADIQDFPDRGYGAVTLVSGGFPCQPFSTASRGRRVAEDLREELLRVVERLSPEWVLAENVQRQPVAELGAEWKTRGYRTALLRISAASVGAPHRRRRWFVVAYANSNGKRAMRFYEKMAGLSYFPKLATWQRSPRFGVGVDDGIPHRVDRLRCLGNAVVPQVVYPILQAIAEVGSD